MSVRLDAEPREAGTRFRLFPQPPFLSPDRPPETVRVSSAAGTVGPGPSDRRMYVIDPVGKEDSYGLQRGPMGSPYLYLPPWDGPVAAPATPDRAGHFDHIPVGTPAFEAAHVFGTARFVLDVWEGYFGGRIPWHFRSHYRRLEIVLMRELNNARMGYGFLEVGRERADDGTIVPYSLHFDVIAHEVGHALIFAVLGMPREGATRGEFYGFHESAADLVSLVTVLHFGSVVEDLLNNTRGNLYRLNRLNRIGELSENEQVRLASNTRTLWDFADGWDDEHDLSEPLTGALFDVLVDIFHEALLARGLIDPRLEAFADVAEYNPAMDEAIQAGFDRAYGRNPEGFRDALTEARDIMGSYLADSWQRLTADHLGYDDVAMALLETDRRLNCGRFSQAIINNFRARGVGTVRIGPPLAGWNEGSHAFSDRTLHPGHVAGLPDMPFRERMGMAGFGKRVTGVVGLSRRRLERAW